MRKVNLIFLEDVSETKWEQGRTEILLKCRDEQEKEIGEVFVDDESITYKFKNVDDDMYRIKRYLREILKNSKIERNFEKVYINGKLFGERKEEERFVYCETENEIEFLNFVSSFDDISQTFYNSSKKFEVKFFFNEGKGMLIYVKLSDKLFMENRIKKEIVDTEDGIEYIDGKEYSVKVNDIVAASSALKWISSYKFNSVQTFVLLLKKAIIKKLPKNNLTDNCNEIWSSFEEFENNVKMTPEMIYVLSNFYYSPSMSFDKALKTISEATKNKRISSFKIATEKGKLDFDSFGNKKLVLKSKNGAKINEAIEDFNKISEYVKEFKLEYCKKVKYGYYSGTEININILSHENEILIAKRAFAKTDFKYLRELSEKTGKEIKFGIINSYDNFKIDGGTLKIKVGSWDNKRIEEYKKKFSEAFQYFENVETYSN